MHTHSQTADPPSNTQIISQKIGTDKVYKDDFQLECSANGMPAPNFTWILNGTVNLTQLAMAPNARYKLSKPRGRLLSITRVTYKDTGTYTCIASNKAGMNSTSINVKIKGTKRVCFKSLS